MTEQEKPEPKLHPWYSKSTALTISLSLVTCVTGILMFLKIGEHSVRGLHEWLGVAFVVAAVFHSLRHWKVITRYVSIMPFWAVTIPVIVVSALFLIPSTFPGGAGEQRMGPPGYYLLGSVRVEHLAEMTTTSVDVLIERLKASGITARSPQDTLDSIAQAANRKVPELLAIMVP